MARLRWITCFVVSLFLLGQAALAPAEENALLFVDEPLPPYSIGRAGEPAREGICLRLLQEIGRRMECGTRLELMPWKRALHMVRTGHADGVPLLMMSEDRARYIRFTDPVRTGRERVHFRKDCERCPELRTLDEFRGLRIGLVQGYSYGDNLLERAEKLDLNVEFAISSDANFRKLHSGRVDIVVEDDKISEAFMRRQPEMARNLRSLPEPLAVYTWHMGLSRTSGAAALVPRINAILRDMRHDGTLERILAPAR